MFYVDVLFIIHPMLVDIENCRYSFVCPNGTVFSQERLVGPKSINLYNFISFIHTIILLFMAIQFKVIFPFILHQDH